MFVAGVAAHVDGEHTPAGILQTYIVGDPGGEWRRVQEARLVGSTAATATLAVGGARLKGQEAGGGAPGQEVSGGSARGRWRAAEARGAGDGRRWRSGLEVGGGSERGVRWAVAARGREVGGGGARAGGGQRAGGRWAAAAGCRICLWWGLHDGKFASQVGRVVRAGGVELVRLV